jgi:hypothetical protein
VLFIAEGQLRFDLAIHKLLYPSIVDAVLNANNLSGVGTVILEPQKDITRAFAP